MAGILGLGAVTVKTLNIRFKSMRTQLIIGLVVLMMMGTRTVVRSFDFRNEFTLNSHDVKVSRDDYNLEGGLASNLLNLGRTREALMHAENSIRLNPFWSNYNTLGSIYLSLGEFSKARNAYDKALSFTDYYQVYENIAGMTLLTGEYEENVNLIKSYIERFPQHDKLWLYIAILQYTHGDTIEGKAAIMKAQEFNYSGNPEIKAIYYAIMNNLPLKLNLKVGND
jgi:tetratricopeptide (TPR) repeat protein